MKVECLPQAFRLVVVSCASEAEIAFSAHLFLARTFRDHKSNSENSRQDAMSYISKLDLDKRSRLSKLGFDVASFKPASLEATVLRWGNANIDVARQAPISAIQATPIYQSYVTFEPPLNVI